MSTTTKPKTKKKEQPVVAAEAKRDWANFLVPEGVDRADIIKLAPGAMPPLPPVVIDPKQFCLKKFEFSSALSEETNAFTAEIHFEGKLVGYARNSGHGGGTIIHPAGIEKRDAFKACNDWAAALPYESSWQYLYNEMRNIVGDYAAQDQASLRQEWWNSTHDTNLEWLVDGVVGRMATAKTFRNKTRSVVLARYDDAEIPAIYTLRTPPTQDWLKAASAKYGWAVPIGEFLSMPYHYYPAPHRWGRSWPRQEVALEGDDRRWEVDLCNTTDDCIVISLPDDKDTKQSFTVEEANLKLKVIQ